MQLQTAGLVIINKNKVLLAYSTNKQCFYLPGGKLGSGETARAALCREVAEELGVQLQETDLVYFTHISAAAFGEEPGTSMEQDCFFTNKRVRAKAMGEISELRYFALAEYQQEIRQAPGVLMIMHMLETAGYLHAPKKSTFNQP